jgi:hypothetical protein
MPCKCLPGAPCAPGCSTPGAAFTPPAFAKTTPTGAAGPGLGSDFGTTAATPSAVAATTASTTSGSTQTASPGQSLAGAGPGGAASGGAGGAAGGGAGSTVSAPTPRPQFAAAGSRVDPPPAAGLAGEIAPDTRRPWGPTGCPTTLDCTSTVCRQVGCHQDLSTCKTFLGPAPVMQFTGGPWLECRGGGSHVVHPRPAPWTEAGKGIYRPQTPPGMAWTTSTESSLSDTAPPGGDARLPVTSPSGAQRAPIPGLGAAFGPPDELEP